MANCPLFSILNGRPQFILIFIWIHYSSPLYCSPDHQSMSILYTHKNLSKMPPELVVLLGACPRQNLPEKLHSITYKFPLNSATPTPPHSSPSIFPAHSVPSYTELPRVSPGVPVFSTFLCSLVYAVSLCPTFFPYIFTVQFTHHLKYVLPNSFFLDFIPS